MSLSRRGARPLLASVFISSGLDALRHPEAKVESAETVVMPLLQRIPQLPRDPETLIQLNGAVQVGAGMMLAVGRLRRLAALALIGSIIPTTYAGHRFWEETDDVDRAEQRIHFLKNLGLLGGLMLAAVDTEGAPSLGWRARHRARRWESRLESGRQRSTSTAHHAGELLADTVTQGASTANDLTGLVVRAGSEVAGPLAAAGAGRAVALLAGSRDSLRRD